MHNEKEEEQLITDIWVEIISMSEVAGVDRRKKMQKCGDLINLRTKR